MDGEARTAAAAGAAATAADALAQGLSTAFAGLNAVAVKVPTFWSHQARLWFIRLEAEFAAARITTQEARYSHVVRNLTEEAAVEVKDLLETPPAANQYNSLKEALIKAFQPTTSARLCKFNQLTVGDLRPSQLLRAMKDLNNEAVDSTLYREAFLSKLPNMVQIQLATHAGNITSLADAADLVVDRMRCQAIGSTVNEVTSLANEDLDLQAAVDAVYTRFGKRPPPPRGQQQRKPQQDKERLCFFHNRFGAKAQKCTPGCSWQPQQAGNAKGS